MQANNSIYTSNNILMGIVTKPGLDYRRIFEYQYSYNGITSKGHTHPDTRPGGEEEEEEEEDEEEEEVVVVVAVVVAV